MSEFQEKEIEYINGDIHKILQEFEDGYKKASVATVYDILYNPNICGVCKTCNKLRKKYKCGNCRFCYDAEKCRLEDQKIYQQEYTKYNHIYRLI